MALEQYVTKDKMREVIQNAPAGTPPEYLLQQIVDSGRTVE